MEFVEFPKIPRVSRGCIITEKIDGNNACVWIGEDGEFKIASRSRFITPETDNHGFARWAYEHKDEMMLLGPGTHFGEWWGRGIQRGYGLDEKRFSLFNTARWLQDFRNERPICPTCCHVVPVLFRGMFTTTDVSKCLAGLTEYGSWASAGFKPAEGVVIYHTAARMYFKETLLNDDAPKGTPEVSNGLPKKWLRELL